MQILSVVKIIYSCPLLSSRLLFLKKDLLFTILEDLADHPMMLFKGLKIWNLRDLAYAYEEESPLLELINGLMWRGWWPNYEQCTFLHAQAPDFYALIEIKDMSPVLKFFDL